MATLPQTLLMKRFLWFIGVFTCAFVLSHSDARGQAEWLPVQYTRKLPRIDKVELQKIQPKDMWIGTILGSKTLEGKEARRIASLWRAQKFRSYSAICHEPVYGIKFFSKGRLILYASVCWDCNNIILQEPQLKSGGKQGFNGESKMGRRLLEEFMRIFPLFPK